MAIIIFNILPSNLYAVVKWRTRLSGSESPLCVWLWPYRCRCVVSCLPSRPWSVSLHISVRTSPQHFSPGRLKGEELPQLLFVCVFVWESRLLLHTWRMTLLYGVFWDGNFFFQHFELVIPFSPGLWGSFVGFTMLLSGCF